ncbi:hypothetical protein GCM10023208_08230 [Erythrobacter westpacificensis]|uniref:PilZ domain-containing protein n=1 Tax=Erythrobacter westpacificensis TaxID=1055231 RepID=A0ABP9K4C0_9SPHN
MNLGSEQNFWVVAEKLFNELHPHKKPPVSEAQSALSPNAEHASVQQDGAQAERDEPRFDVTLIGRMYGSHGSREVTIFDLSTRGCRVEDLSHAKPGSIVTIKIGTVGPIGAVIRWRRQNFVGLKFENPLHPAVLENIRTEHSLR